MSVKKIKSNSFNVLVEKFASMTQLIETINQRPHNRGNFEDSKQDTNPSFSGIKSWKEGCELVHSFEKNIEKVKTEIKKIDDKKTVQTKRSKQYEDVAGFVPVVPHALMNLPKSMINSQIVLKKSKVINVMIDVTYSWMNTTEKIANYYSKVLAYLIGLEKQGFRVRISLIMNFGTESSSQQHSCIVLLKNENQPIDIKRMMFPITHTGTLRVFGFSWYERLEGAIYIGGYGTAMHNWGIKTKAEELKKVLGELNSKVYYLYYKCDYEMVFKNVK